MDYNVMFDMISAACGAYILFTWYKLRLAGRLFPNGLLIPKDKTPKDCVDAPGYIQYISPRLLIIGVVIAMVGIVGLVNDFVHFFGTYPALALNGVALAALIWFAVCANRASRRFW